MPTPPLFRSLVAHSHLRASALLCASAFCLLSLFSSPAAAQPAPPPDTIYHHATIYTVNDESPTAQAIAITGDRIEAVGTNGAVLALAGPETVLVNLDSKTVLPGLIDAHGHLAGLGALSLGVIDLSYTRTYQQVIDLVRAKADRTPKGDWVIGRGWDQESWPGKQMPTHDQLTEAVPDHPVTLSRVDGHALLANQAAMDIAEISPETPSPSGGEILKDSDGEPTGVFVDNAEGLIGRAIPESARIELAASLLAAQEQCFSAGLTGVHDMGVSPTDLKTFEALVNDGVLKLRVYAVLSGAYAKDYFAEHGLTIGDTLTVRSTKLYMDGAMGSRGAWMLEPYADRPTDADGNPYTGLAVSETAYIADITADGIRNGYQVCTHAIGDRGNREALDAYLRGEFMGTDGIRPIGAEEPTMLADARFRIEHAQLLSPADIPRFAQLGVIPSMQPKHCTSDMRWVDARVGPERAKGAYAWRSLTDSGAPIVAGSDFPVEPHNPFLGFHSAVTRQNGDSYPPGGWHPEQKLTRMETLKAFTINAAYAAFEENTKGTLEPGKLADFIVIDRDVMTCPEAEILETRVLTTILGGQVVYEAPPATPLTDPGDEP
ncbi:MAG: putative amidohydrolase YtcJ [Phycisphaerales bacterium]|jgi:predicted amidohydrolase YtcJ